MKLNLCILYLSVQCLFTYVLFTCTTFLIIRKILEVATTSYGNFNATLLAEMRFPYCKRNCSSEIANLSTQAKAVESLFTLKEYMSKLM